MVNTKSPELRRWHKHCLTMSMGKRLGRLFVIRTRWEAWAVTWAIALGAVERGRHYLSLYPGWIGWMFFGVCLLVVFVAGPKLLDSVRPQQRKKTAPRLAPRRAGRLRTTVHRRPVGSAAPTWSRRG